MFFFIIVHLYFPLLLLCDLQCLLVICQNVSILSFHLCSMSFIRCVFATSKLNVLQSVRIVRLRQGGHMGPTVFETRISVIRDLFVLDMFGYVLCIGGGGIVGGFTISRRCDVTSVIE